MLALLTPTTSNARWPGLLRVPSVEHVNNSGDIVDVHAHIVPAGLLSELESHPWQGIEARRTDAGWVVTVPGAGPTRPIRPRMTDPAKRAEWLAQTGITHQVLSPWLDIQSPQLEPAAARDWAHRLNDAMLGTARDAGTVTLVSLTLADPDNAAADLAKLWSLPEVAGAVLSTDDVPLHDPQLDPLWTLAEQERIPLMLHPPTCGPSGDLSNIGSLGNVHGRLIDNTVAVSKLILHGLLDRHPGLRLVLVHGGGFLPYQAARLDGGYRTGEVSAGELQRGKPSAYLADFYYDTVALSAPSISFLAGLVGDERMLLGSDYPFALGDPDPVGTARAADVTGILRENAAEVFSR